MTRWLILGVLLELLAACGEVDLCEGVPCSEGRACVVREKRPRCEPVDAGVP